MMDLIEPGLNAVEVKKQPSIKEAALAYAQAGLAVIPLRGRYGKDYDNAKMPILKEWQKMTPRPDLIEAWTTQKPDIDIGLLCGKASNIFVLDADKEIGMQTADNLKLPKTAINVTPKGKQYLFAWDSRLDGIPTNLVKPFPSLPGLDFRGDGGFIVCPPSRNLGDKQYAWLNDESPLTTKLAPIPEWLVQMFIERTTAGEDFANAPAIDTETWFEKIKDGVAEGANRHKAMTQLVSFYMSRGIPEDDVFTLMKLWNEKCEPPKPEDEFLEKLNSFLDNWRTGKYKSTYKPPITEIKGKSLSEFLAEGDTKIDWLVEGLIPKEALTFVYGYQGTGKSFMTLDLAIEMGRGGGLWLGRFPVEGGKVLYLDEESHPKLLRSRYNQMLAAKNLKHSEVSMTILSQPQIKLDQDASVKLFKAYLTEIQPDLVIIDSFSTIHQLNENGAPDMGRLRDYFKDIIKDCKCGLLFIDHEGQPSMVYKTAAQKQRGNSTKGDMADCKLHLSEANGVWTVEHAKPRWGMKHPPFNLEIVDPAPQQTAIRFTGLAEQKGGF